MKFESKGRLRCTVLIPRKLGFNRLCARCHAGCRLERPQTRPDQAERFYQRRATPYAAACHFTESLVTGGMSIDIVDRFEFIQVNKEQEEFVVRIYRKRNLFVDQVIEQRPV